MSAIRDFIDTVTAHDSVSPFNDATLLALDERQQIRVERDGVLAGLALSRVLDHGAGIEAELAVLPSFRRRGIGTQLLQQLVDQLTEQHDRSGQGVLQVWAHGNLPGAAQLAEAAGLKLSRELFVMEVALSEVVDQGAEAPLPEGFRIRAFDPHTDREAWVGLNARVFANHPEQGSLTVGDLDARIAQDWFDASGFLLLEHRGELVGYNWLKNNEIYVIGVDESLAGHGLGRALMAAGFAKLRENGHTTAMLYVDGTNAAARALYQKLGFADVFVDAQYSRGL